LTRKLLLASAGAGKSELIAKKAVEAASNGDRVLLLTYTINNQAELIKHICRLNKYQPRNIVIKGWFTFLLEDMIRPYQRCIVTQRIAGIVLDSSNPHWNGRFQIPGRAEKAGDVYNPRHFVTKTDSAAHTTFLSKLAARIHERTGGMPAQRLVDIYKSVFVDEVQDLVGWDYEIIRAIIGANVGSFDCVGDFRQTIYQTSPATKGPRTNAQKLAAFAKMGFVREDLNISWRCIQSICDLAHLLHANDGHYAPTESKIEEIPPEFADHHGIFALPASRVDAYVGRYKPVILRWNRQAKSDLCEGRTAYNFGESKGLGFERVLILPTGKHARFLSGDQAAFGNDDTDGARNKLYVGITRARYSVAFPHDGGNVINGAQVWDAAN
jgi:DNA helicase-2/ATP-dependent DNA helicase PcrA